MGQRERLATEGFQARRTYTEIVAQVLGVLEKLSGKQLTTKDLVGTIAVRQVMPDTHRGHVSLDCLYPTRWGRLDFCLKYTRTVENVPHPCNGRSHNDLPPTSNLCIFCGGSGYTLHPEIITHETSLVVACNDTECEWDEKKKEGRGWVSVTGPLVYYFKRGKGESEFAPHELPYELHYAPEMWGGKPPYRR